LLCPHFDVVGSCRAVFCDERYAPVFAVAPVYIAGFALEDVARFAVDEGGGFALDFYFSTEFVEAHDAVGESDGREVWC
jgi:hypothetical protein